MNYDLSWIQTSVSALFSVRIQVRDGHLGWFCWGDWSPK